MVDFLLIRHTSTDDVDDRLAGRIDTPLNGVGFEEARQLAEALGHLPLTAIYASPMQRTMQTADALGDVHGLPVHADEAFIQVNYGDWESVPYDELRENPQWHAFISSPGGQVPGGEHIDGVVQRVTRRLEELTAEYSQHAVIAVISHGSVIRFTLAHYLGMPTGYANRLKVLPGSVSGLRLGGSTPTVFGLNQEFV